MSRIYRVIIFAAIGWPILIASLIPNDEGKAGIPQTVTLGRKSSAKIAIVVSNPVKIIRPTEKQQLCGPEKYASDDDLCAQWKAADAATDGARWSFWSLILAAVGTIGVLISLYYTRKAVLAAEDATNDADLALAIAERNAAATAQHVQVVQEAAQKQMRAYLNIKGVKIEPAEKTATAKEVKATIDFINSGQTPAIDVNVGLFISIFPGEFRPQNFPDKSMDAHGSRTVLGSGIENQICSTQSMADGSDMVQVFTGNYHIVAHGFIRYTDIFGHVHETRFCQYRDPTTRDLGFGSVAASVGNSMT